jgi:peroxiredoxin
MTNLNQLPTDLPVPHDDGACNHLVGIALPNIPLVATDGSMVNLSQLPGRLAIYCYPMTGQPNVPLPEGWDQIPGARGCTPQSCAYRDHYQELQALNVNVFGLSVQSTDYQREMATRLHLPFPVLSDALYQFQKVLNLPTFEAAGMTLLKRVTLIATQGRIEAVHYPIFPSDSDPAWVLNYFQTKAGTR